MKKLKKAFVLMTFISLMFCLSNLVFALDKEVKVTVQKGNVRVKPSLQSTVIGRVPLGASFKVLETEGEWFKISLPPDEDGFVISGYIHSSVVEVSEVEKAEENIETEKESKKAKRKKEAKIQEGNTSPPPPSEPQYEQPPARSGGMGFGFKLSGGGSYLMLGNLNQFFDDRNSWINDVADTGTIVGSYPNLNLGFGGGAEFILYFTPNIGVGVGADFLSASYSSGNVEWEETLWIWALYSKESTDMTLSAIPLKLSLHFNLPMGSSMNLAFNVGGGYYLGTFKQDLTGSGIWFVIPFYDFEDSVTASPSTFGFHGGLGFEFNVSPGVALCLDIQGRYAQFSEITGTYKYDDLTGTGEEERTLYTTKYGSSDQYLMYGWYETAPVNSEIATIDLSGIDFKFGVKITF